MGWKGKADQTWLPTISRLSRYRRMTDEMVNSQFNINCNLMMDGTSYMDGLKVSFPEWQFGSFNLLSKNPGRLARKIPSVVFNICVSALLLVNFSGGALADEKPLLIEGVVKTGGPQFAWFVEDLATDAAFQSATLAIKFAIDNNGLQVLNNQIFAIYSHSSLIKNRRLDLNYMQLLKQTLGSE